MFPYKACLGYQDRFLNNHHEIIDPSNSLENRCVLQHLLLLGYRLPSWPVGRHTTQKDERKEGGIIKSEKTMEG